MSTQEINIEPKTITCNSCLQVFHLLPGETYYWDKYVLNPRERYSLGFTSHACNHFKHIMSDWNTPYVSVPRRIMVSKSRRNALQDIRCSYCQDPIEIGTMRVIEANTKHFHLDCYELRSLLVKQIMDKVFNDTIKRNRRLQQ